jgi:hypothetical protein
MNRIKLNRWIPTWAVTLTLLGVWSTAQATSFAQFQLYTGQNGEDLSVSADAYPGKIAIVNYRNESVCVNFKILDAQNQVLRYSKLRVHIPAKRTDLALTGPGDNATSVRMAVQVGASAPCGPSSSLGAQLFISPGNVGGNGPVEFNASTWNSKTRDILIEIKP